MLQNFPHEFLSVQVSTLQNRSVSKKKLSSKRHQSVTRSYAHTHENCVNKTSTDSKSSREKKEKNQRLGRFGRGGTNGKRLWTSGARELTVLLLVGCWKLEAKHTQQSSIIFWYWCGGCDAKRASNIIEVESFLFSFRLCVIFKDIFLLNWTSSFQSIRKETVDTRIRSEIIVVSQECQKGSVHCADW